MAKKKPEETKEILKREDTNLPQASSMAQPPALVSQTEMATSMQASSSLAEIQGAIVVAKQFPRNEDLAFQNLLHVCNRLSFAEESEYRFPRGGKNVDGGSVYLAREAARIWGNMRHGFYIISDDQHKRTIRGWAWDVETNSKSEADATFEKKTLRNGKWVYFDDPAFKDAERALREITNKNGAILKRNCIFELLPKDLIEDARRKCKETMRQNIQDDPDAGRKKVITAFDSINVTVKQIDDYLGHPLKEANPTEITELIAMGKSIKDGNSTWTEYVEKKESPTKANADMFGGKKE